MIKITLKNKEVKQKDVTGNAADILTDLSCIVDSILEDAVLATGGLESKEKLLKVMINGLEMWWEHEKTQRN